MKQNNENTLLESLNKKSKGWKIASRFWKHKYLWTFTIFFIVIGLVDPNSLLRRYEQRQRISELQDEIAERKANHKEVLNKLNDLDHHPQNMEKIAREKYFMKTANEDVYVIENSSDENNVQESTN